MEKNFTILNVFDAFFNNCRCFLKEWKIWFSYAVALFILSFVCFNWSHSCKDDIAPFWWCASFSNIYLAYGRAFLYFAGIFFFAFSFVYDVYQPALNGAKSNFFTIVKVTKAKLKFIGFSFGICALFFILLALCFWIIFRKANPNWMIEFGWFCFVFAFAAFAVLILRTSASLGMFLMNGKVPDFKAIFRKTSGKFYVVLVTYCLLVYVVNLLLMKFLGVLDALNFKYSFFALVLISEFLSSILKFFAIGTYGAYFLALAQVLMPKEETSHNNSKIFEEKAPRKKKLTQKKQKKYKLPLKKKV